jgi:hypothetical protein
MASGLPFDGGEGNRARYYKRPAYGKLLQGPSQDSGTASFAVHFQRGESKETGVCAEDDNDMIRRRKGRLKLLTYVIKDGSFYFLAK